MTHHAKQKDASIPTIPLNARISRWFGRNLIRIYAVFGFTYLFIPVAYTFAFSFNDSGKSNLVWKGFTLDNWKNPCGAPEVCEALGNSIKIGLIATIFDDSRNNDRLCNWPICIQGSLIIKPFNLLTNGNT